MSSGSSSSLLTIAGTSIGSGVITALVPPRRLPPTARRSMHAALGLLSGGAMLVALTRRGAPPVRGDGAATEPSVDAAEPLPLPTRVAFASAFGGLIALASVAGGVLDGRLEEAFKRRGAKHPRVWVGVAAAALTAATSLADERRSTEGSTTSPATPA